MTSSSGSHPPLSSWLSALSFCLMSLMPLSFTRCLWFPQSWVPLDRSGYLPSLRSVVTDHLLISSPHLTSPISPSSPFLHRNQTVQYLRFLLYGLFTAVTASRISQGFLQLTPDSLTVNLTWFGIVVETYLWVRLWGCFQQGLTREGRPILNVSGAVSSARLPYCIERRKKASICIHLDSWIEPPSVMGCLTFLMPW